MKGMRGITVGAVLLACGCSVFAGSPGTPPAADPPRGLPLADPTPVVPVPDSYGQALARGTRSTTGAPGPEYWQNRVVYTIEAELDPDAAIVRGVARIVYHNRSPHTLPSVVLNLYQNVFSEGVPRNRYVPVTGGVTLHRVAAGGVTLPRLPVGRIPISGDVPSAPVGYSVQGTLARARLPHAIAPGDSVVLDIAWEHTVPPYPSFRTGWEESLGSRVFHVAQWYPQIATFDDLRGWDATPYLGDGEFYLEYGDFEVSITLPEGYLVAATGELLNPEEVLTEEARRRLAAGLTADSVTHVVTEADITAENATLATAGGQLTWRFSASDVRDFAFSASSGYVWDVTAFDVPDPSAEPRRIALHALYRPAATNWENALTYARHAMGEFHEALIPYAYPQLTVAEGPIGGMEYPMLIFIGRPSSPEALYAVIAHEAAHQWFPMTVGGDEAAYAWMDEGFATLFESLAAAEFFGFPDPLAADRASYLSVAGTDLEVPLMRHTDLVTPYGNRVVAAYSKPAVLLHSLRWLLTEDRFRQALNAFARDWLFKHPTPWDFFSAMEREANADLDWFFGPWWFETAVLDRRIASVEGADSGRAVVTIEDMGRARAPGWLVGTTASGDTVSAYLPAGYWSEGNAGTAVLEADEPIVRIHLDPERIFPDVDSEDDVWTADPTAP